MLVVIQGFLVGVAGSWKPECCWCRCGRMETGGGEADGQGIPERFQNVDAKEPKLQTLFVLQHRTLRQCSLSCSAPLTAKEFVGLSPKI